ncbi:MAG TPA: hypothetical protein DEB39_02700 [Planctomycetaceae bacterium]|nr:hypothetical protein [Planctomycetaceae bacterium]
MIDTLHSHRNRSGLPVRSVRDVSEAGSRNPSPPENPVNAVISKFKFRVQEFGLQVENRT